MTILILSLAVIITALVWRPSRVPIDPFAAEVAWRLITGARRQPQH